MAGVVIFGGTSEGRRLAEYCRDKKIKAAVSVVSDYGKSLLPDSAYVTVHEKALSENEMRQWLEEEKPDMVIDATHPYAACVTEYIKKNCEILGIQRLRVLRKRADIESGRQHIVTVGSAKGAAEYLSLTQGNILLTTGSKELEEFTRIPGYEDRVFARVLPSVEVIEKCHSLSIKGKHIVAMQGPFSKDMNKAMMEQLHIRFLVTKEAGTAGGFEEKIEGAQEAGANIVVIGRPLNETGITVEEAEKYLEGYTAKESEESGTKRKIFLIGTGMGGRGQMTERAVSAIKQCQSLFGASRMVQAAADISPEACIVQEYRADRILAWLKEHKEVKVCGALYSGDTGFYSGASGFLKYLEEEEKRGEEVFEAEVLPGISTVSYMASRLKKDWQDIVLLSSHGRFCDVEKNLESLDERAGIFLLTEGKNSVNTLCGRLERAEEERKQCYRVYIGENLSYPEEKIRTGRPDEMKNGTYQSLAAVWIEKET